MTNQQHNKSKKDEKKKGPKIVGKCPDPKCNGDCNYTEHSY